MAVEHQSLKELSQLPDEKVVELWLEQRGLVAVSAADWVKCQKVSAALADVKQKYEPHPEWFRLGKRKCVND